MRSTRRWRRTKRRCQRRSKPIKTEQETWKSPKTTGTWKRAGITITHYRMKTRRSNEQSKIYTRSCMAPWRNTQPTRISKGDAESVYTYTEEGIHAATASLALHAQVAQLQLEHKNDKRDEFKRRKRRRTLNLNRLPAKKNLCRKGGLSRTVQTIQTGGKTHWKNSACWSTW